MPVSIAFYRHQVRVVNKQKIRNKIIAKFKSVKVSKNAQHTDVAEDWSKVQTADNIIVYNQTDAEKSVGCARLFVAKARNEEDGFSILINQQYKTGQFCLQSAIMRSKYDDMLEDIAP